MVSYCFTSRFGYGTCGNEYSRANDITQLNTKKYLLIQEKHNNDNSNTNTDGNFICVFECTIVNLATYRQFTNAA